MKLVEEKKHLEIGVLHPDEKKNIFWLNSEL